MDSEKYRIIQEMVADVSEIQAKVGEGFVCLAWPRKLRETKGVKQGLEGMEGGRWKGEMERRSYHMNKADLH